jgi:hypothetical protein
VNGEEVVVMASWIVIGGIVIAALGAWGWDLIRRR